LEIRDVQKYDEELFKILFDLTNEIEIRKICIKLHRFLSNEDKKNICAKIKRSLFFNDITFEVVAYLQGDWKIVFEAKFTKAQLTIITDRLKVDAYYDLDTNNVEEITQFFNNSNVKVESLHLYNVKKYDKKLFKSLFDFTNKIEIREIRIKFDVFLNKKDVKITCSKIEDKITQSLFSNDIQIEVVALLQRYWELILETKFTQGQPIIFTNREYVNL